MQTTIIRAVGVQTKKHGKRPRAYNLYRAVVLRADEKSPGRLVWAVGLVIGFWRYNFNDSWDDATIFASQNDIKTTRTAKIGDRVII